METLWDRLQTRAKDDSQSPGSTTTSAASGSQLMEALRASVCRDLHRLLNTRRAASEAEVESVNQLDHSLLAYGIPEFENFNPGAASHCHELARRIQKAIERFEPRLDSVEVQYWQSDQSQATPNVHLRIRARLLSFNAAEPVRFDTELDLETLQFDVKK